MQINNKIVSIAGLLSIMFLASCKKEGNNIFNMFKDVQVTFNDNSPYCVTGYKEVNDGDSVYLDFTITSASKDMYTVCAFEVGTSGPFKKIDVNSEHRRSYSDVIRLKADSRTGEITYRIWALDKNGIYIGDGYKTVTINVVNNFTYYINRYVYNPDSVGQASNCYLSVTSGETFNYFTSGTNAEKIDLGIYSTAATPPATGRVWYLYSPAASPLPFKLFDINSWTKRGTLFSAPKSGQTTAFLALTTGSKLAAAAKAANPSQKAPAASIVAGSIVYFITPENKYGALLFNTTDTDFTGAFWNVSIKVQQ